MDATSAISRMSPSEVVFEVNRGARFVVYQYCVSLIVITLRRNSSTQFIKADENPALKSLPYTLLSLVFGWWGIPWGFIYTPQVIYRNLKGGTDITHAVLANLQRANPPAQPPPLP